MCGGANGIICPLSDTFWRQTKQTIRVGTYQKTKRPPTTPNNVCNKNAPAITRWTKKGSTPKSGTAIWNHERLLADLEEMNTDLETHRLKCRRGSPRKEEKMEPQRWKPRPLASKWLGFQLLRPYRITRKGGTNEDLNTQKPWKLSLINGYNADIWWISGWTIAVVQILTLKLSPLEMQAIGQ